MMRKAIERLERDRRARLFEETMPTAYESVPDDWPFVRQRPSAE